MTEAEVEVDAALAPVRELVERMQADGDLAAARYLAAELEAVSGAAQRITMRRGSGC